MVTRKIIHIDMDCFFAAVEMRDNPSYRNIPLAIGGSTVARGVVATANYIARRFGVHSAMSSALALKKCPHLTLIAGNMAKYKEASEIIRKIFYQYTDLVEPLSLDEAYLDVSGCLQLNNSATWIAREIREKIYQNTGLTASAGIAPNKFLAKVASEWHKPNGQKVVTPSDVMNFVRSLNVEKINGVGKVSTAKLHALGIKKCSDIQLKGAEFMHQKFGKFGTYLYQLSHGLDDRQVITDYSRKSLSVEKTFTHDIQNFDLWKNALLELLEELNKRLELFKNKKKPHFKINKMTLKLKYFDFTQTTLQKTGENDFLGELWERHKVSDECKVFATELLQQMQKKRSDPVRLIGVGVGFKNLDDQDSHTQLPLFTIS